MSKFAKLAALAAGASMLFVPAAQATHRGDCGGDIGGTEGSPVVERGAIVDVGGALYLDVRAVADQDSLFSIWVYGESNGQPGLQRGNGATPEPLNTIYNLTNGIATSSIDPCVESGTPDTLYF